MDNISILRRALICVCLDVLQIGDQEVIEAVKSTLDRNQIDLRDLMEVQDGVKEAPHA
jgi:hypothetical protein